MYTAFYWEIIRENVNLGTRGVEGIVKKLDMRCDLDSRT